MAQVLKLLTLSSAVQSAILCGKLEVSERSIKPVLWREQEVILRR